LSVICSIGFLLVRLSRPEWRIPDRCGGLQAFVRGHELDDGAETAERKRRDICDLEAARVRLGHPSRDFEIDPVRPPHGDGKLHTAGVRDHFQLLPREWVERVVDRDSRRQGIVEPCC
jgi:hypothetical protein